MKQNKIKSSLLLACGLAFVALPCAFAEHHMGGHPTDAMFKAADTNNDGQLTRAEHAAHGKTMFTDMDTNRDGMVTLAEMTTAHAKMKSDKAMKGAAHNQADKTDKVAKAGKDARDQMSPAAMFEMHDTNKDGKLSAAEHAAACDAMFTKMDTNNDGQLSKEECKTGQNQAKSAY